MTRRFLCFLISLALVYPAGAVMQNESAELAQGIRQIEEGDLAAAIITLDAVVQKLNGMPGRTSELALAHLYLGMAHLGISQWERAKTEMREAWRNNKGMKLDPKKFPPRVIQAYEDAKKEADRDSSSSKAPAAPPAPSPAAKSGGGSSKALLVVGGLAAVGGGIAVAGGGGGGSKPAPAPAPTPRPTPFVLQTGVLALPSPNLFSATDFTLPSAGLVQFTVNWTFSTSTFQLIIRPGACPGGASVASIGPSSTRPLTLTYTAPAGGPYCRNVVYVSGVGAESYSTQVVFTPQ